MDFEGKDFISILKIFYRGGGHDVILYYSDVRDIDVMLKQMMSEQYIFANKLKDYHPIMINTFDIRSIEEVSLSKEYRKWVSKNI